MVFIKKLKQYFVSQKILSFVSLILFLNYYFLLVLSGLITADNFFFFSKYFRYGLLGVFFIVLFSAVLRQIKKEFKKNNFTETIAELDEKLQTDDVFINAYFLSSEEPNPFTEELIRKADEKSAEISFRHIDKKTLKRRLYLNGLLIGLFFIYGVLLPKNFLLSTSRILLPWKDFSKNLFFLDYKIYPGNKDIVFGCSEKIILQSSDKIREAVLYYKGGGTDYEKEPLLLESKEKNHYIYSAVIRDIQENIAYYVKITGKEHGAVFYSKKYTLQSVQAPLIQKIQVSYILPSYAGGGTLYQNENGNIEGLQGSRVIITAEANKNIKKAYCVFNQKKQSAQVRKRNIKYKFVLNKQGEYYFQLLDFSGLTNSYPVHYTVAVLEDRPPEIEIIKPGRDIEIDSDMNISITIKGRDDYRIQSIVFKHYILRESHRASETNVQVLPIAAEKEIEYSFDFDLSSFDMVPGDTLLYYAEINDGYPDGSHVVRSSFYRIKFPSLMDMYKSVDKEENKNIETLSDIVSKQREYEKKIQDIRATLEKNKKLSFVEKQELQNLLKKEKELLKETKKLSENIKKTAEKIEKNKMNSLEVVKKMKEIQQLLDQIATKEMKEKIDELQKSLENMKLSDKDRQKLSKELSQEKLLKKLDNTLKMLKEIKKKRQLNNIAKKMEHILDKQRDINKQTAEQSQNKPDAEALKNIRQKQEENKQALEDLKKSVENFNQEYNQKNEKIKKDFEKSLQSMRSNRIQQQMNSVKQDLQNKQMKKAQQKEMKLMSDLMSLQNQLTRNIKQQQQKSLEEVLNLLDNTIWNLIGLSEEQRRVAERLNIHMQQKKNLLTHRVFQPDDLFENHEPFSFSDSGEKEIFLKRNLLYNKTKLKSMLEKTALLPEIFYDQFDNIAAQIEMARRNLEEQNIFFSLHYVKMSYDSLNRLILQIMNIKKNVKSQAQSSSQQGMSEGMQQIGKGQQQINQGTKQMMGQIGKKGMTSQQKEYLKQLAYQQQLIKRSFDDLTSGEQGKKFMGDKGKISKEMKEIAEKLRQGRIDKELIKKQNKVLKKLLDSEKSLKVKEKSKQRKAETAETIYKPVSPDNIPQHQLKKKYFDYKAVERYPEDYRQIIEEYLRRIYQ